MSLPFIPQLTNIAYTRRGNAVETMAPYGFAGALRAGASIEPGSGSISIQGGGARVGVMLGASLFVLGGAAIGGAISGKKAGRGRNALGGVLGAFVGSVIGGGLLALMPPLSVSASAG